MARVSFSDENIQIKNTANQRYPKLTGLKKGEKVRIQLVDPEAVEMAYVHNLRVPVIENGQGVMGEDNKWTTRFIGNPLSFGDLSIIEEKGIDTKNCIISKFHKDHPTWVDAPTRKFAIRVVVYKTRAGSFNLSTPFQVEHKVWVFTDKTFLKLREFSETWGDLRKHDLFIECENERFQQYSIQVAPDAAWATEKKVKEVKEVYDAGEAEYPDLELAIGSRKEERWVERDLAEIEEAWGIVLGNSSTSNFTDADGMVDFLDTPTSKKASPEAEADSDEADAEDSSSDAASFEDLLKQLA